MKYYKELAKFETFTLSDAMNIIGNITATKKYLTNMVKAGAVHRIKKNLYTCYNFAEYSDCANHLQIASHINENSFVGLHTAFEFYAFYNQVYCEVQVFSTKRFREFEYAYYYYKCYLTNSTSQVDLIKGIRVTSIERTIVDSINMLGKAMDTEELLKCLDLVHIIDINKIKEMLLEYDIDLLYRKVGYILSYYKDGLRIDDSFFEFCKAKSNRLNCGYLSNYEINGLEYISEWGIYAYKDLKKLVYKGGGIDV